MRASGLGSTAVLRNGCPYVIDAHRWTMRDGRLACYLLVLVVPLLLYVVVCNVSCGVQFGIVQLAVSGPVVHCVVCDGRVRSHCITPGTVGVARASACCVYYLMRCV